MLEIAIDNCNKCNIETINDPNVTFQPNKIFVRNDLSEKIIKSYKSTNLEFLKLKEKLGLCLYEDICNEQEQNFNVRRNFKEGKSCYTAWC